MFKSRPTREFLAPDSHSLLDIFLVYAAIAKTALCFSFEKQPISYR